MAVAMTSVEVKEKPTKTTPKHIPLNTQEYLVCSSDSLASIALRFNTTPAELSRLNRLASRMLYPGQTLFVPGHLEDISQEKTKQAVELVTQEPSGTNTKERAISPDHQIEELLQRELLNSVTDEISEKYLRIKAKFITDGQGVVSGVILITPQTFMFNPCVSDHLVIDRGRDAYALRFPLKSIAQIAFFNDIAAMVTGDRSGQICPCPSKGVSSTTTRSKTSSSFTDMTTDSAICQETGERLSCDTETLQSHFPEGSTKDMLPSVEDMDELEHDIERTDRDPLDASASPLKNSDSTTEKCNTTDEENFCKHVRNPSTDERFKSDTRLCMMDSTTDMEVDGDITHSCPDLSKKDDSPCFQIMTESQSTSTPRKLPEMAKKFPKPPKSTTSPTHSSITNALIDSPLRVRKLTQNRDDLSHLESDQTIEDLPVEGGKTSPVVEQKEQTSKPKRNTFISADYDSEDERSQMPDVSRDSGISEGTSIQSSTNYRHLNGESSKKDKQTTGKRVLSPRSSLSDEARRWLGRRGVRLPSESESSDISLTENAEVFADEILPRPAVRYEDSPVYLCLKIHRSFWCPTRERSSSIMGVPPNRDQKRREHWFALPKERVDQIYAFFLSWSPNLDTKSESSDDRSRKEDFLNASGEEGLNIVDDTFSCSPATQFGFEKLCHDEVDRISTSSNRTLRSVNDEDLPEMLDPSDLLTKRHISLLSRELPSRTVGHSWTLVYSTAVHGISLRTLYRNMLDVDTPVLLAVVDENSKMFGTFMSDAPRISDGFYGTGESMLFTFLDENHLKIYHWSGENNFFIKGDSKSLCIGGGDGLFGLWLDEDLYHGRSHACKTFNNETLSFKEDFICSSLEAWTFV